MSSMISYHGVLYAAMLPDGEFLLQLPSGNLTYCSYGKSII